MATNLVAAAVFGAVTFAVAALLISTLLHATAIVMVGAILVACAVTGVVCWFAQPVLLMSMRFFENRHHNQADRGH